jgi:hypothetical protein
MTDLHERDAMTCRACGNEERASEGYPCAECGTFICQICTMRGVQFCRRCQEQRTAAAGSGSGLPTQSNGKDGDAA